MATAEHIVSIATAALDNDRDRVLSTCRQIIACEKPQSRLRSRLERILQQSAVNGDIPADLKGLVMQMAPRLSLSDVLLSEKISEEVKRFLVERKHVDVLKSAGLKSPHRILLSGPPGNGKTALAGAIANALGLPFLVLDYSNIMSSYMGGTGGNLAKVFRAFSSTPTVLFVDEMETVLTERGRVKDDVGEIARVVSLLLLEIDRLPDYVVLIGATNHIEMLDRAVVRRFEHHWELPPPDSGMLVKWLKRFAKRYPMMPLLENEESLLNGVDGWSFSDVEREVIAWCRRWVVAHIAENQQAADRNGS